MKNASATAHRHAVAKGATEMGFMMHSVLCNGVIRPDLIRCKPCTEMSDNASRSMRYTKSKQREGETRTLPDGSTRVFSKKVSSKYTPLMLLTEVSALATGCQLLFSPTT